MTQRDNITLAVSNDRLANDLHDMLQDVPEADITWINDVRPKSQEPTIILVDDDGSRSIITKLKDLRQQYAKSAIFVISHDKDPEHIIQIMKNGGSEYLLAPVQKESLLKAVNETRAQLESRGGPTGTVYSFISSKGGLGNTFLAVNTAEAMAMDKKESVALWDMSFQSGDSSVMLDIIPETTIIDICRNFQRLDNALLKSAMAKHRNGIDLLCAPMRPEESEEITASQIHKVLSIITRLYDHVFIDCTSMSITDSSFEAFKSSSKIFIVIDLSVPAIRNASRIYDLIQQLGIDKHKVEVIINRYVDKGTLSIEEAERTLGKHIYWLFPNDFDSVISSINNGDPLICSSPRCSLSKSIIEFIGKIKNPELYKEFRGIKRRKFLRDSFHSL